MLYTQIQVYFLKRWWEGEDFNCALDCMFKYLFLGKQHNADKQYPQTGCTFGERFLCIGCMYKKIEHILLTLQNKHFNFLVPKLADSILNKIIVLATMNPVQELLLPKNPFLHTQLLPGTGILSSHKNWELKLVFCGQK